MPTDTYAQCIQKDCQNYFPETARKSGKRRKSCSDGCATQHWLDRFKEENGISYGVLTGRDRRSQLREATQ